jgi:hypothetical protein
MRSASLAAAAALLALAACPPATAQSASPPPTDEEAAGLIADIADASGIAFECRRFDDHPLKGIFACRDEVLGARLEVVVAKWDPAHPPRLSPTAVDQQGRTVRRKDPFPKLPDGTVWIVASLVASGDVRAIGYASMDRGLARTEVYVRGEERDTDGTWVSRDGFLDDDGRPAVAILEYVLGEPPADEPLPESRP